jgi:hypothetical protein
MKNIYNAETDKFKTEEQKYIQKRLEEQKAKFTSIEKQFVASQKFHELRLLREGFKNAAEEGAEVVRFPTPYTLAVIEGYVNKDGTTRYDVRGIVTVDFVQAGFNYAYYDIDLDSWYWCDSNGVNEISPVQAASYDEINYTAQRYGILWTVLLPTYYTNGSWTNFATDYNGNFWWVNSAGNLEDPPVQLTILRVQDNLTTPIFSGIYDSTRYLVNVPNIEPDFIQAGYTFVVAFEESHLWCDASGITEDPAVSAPNFTGYSAERYGITWSATEYIPA